MVALLEGRKWETEYSICCCFFVCFCIFLSLDTNAKTISSQSFLAVATSLKGGQKRKSLRWQNKQPNCEVVTNLQEISGLTSRIVLLKLTLSEKWCQ